MTLNITQGDVPNLPEAQKIVEAVRPYVEEGSIYIGYPVLSNGEEALPIDVSIVSPDYGLIAIYISPNTSPISIDEIDETQDQLLGLLSSKFMKESNLHRRGKLIFPLTCITLMPKGEVPDFDSDVYTGLNISDLDNLGESLSRFKMGTPLSDSQYTSIESAVQSVRKITPRKSRRNVIKDDSRGAKLKFIEKEIASLDKWQRDGAFQTIQGPQRIRGLAGSGKTVVLSLKATFWHVKNPDWNIAVTFQTQSLYQQITQLASDFSYSLQENKFDEKKLQVLHAWGGSHKTGLYQKMALSAGVLPKDFRYAKEKYGRADSFQGVCRELLLHCKDNPPEPIFDAVLIDEAQDLPAEFFTLVYLFTKPPHRIVWAYDELQMLTETSMPTLAEMFGTKRDGAPLVELNGTNEDILLPRCYRNTPWALTGAHALGFGIYRTSGLVQHFGQPSMWPEIGYEVRSGTLGFGNQVQLKRSHTGTPNFFYEVLDQDDAIFSRRFTDIDEQDNWVAEQIHKNLNEEELDPDDILVILPNPLEAYSRYKSISTALTKLGIKSHMPGKDAERNQLYIEDSIAITHIFRAKGNESAMVYVLDSDFGNQIDNLVSRRNILFTAITRSRAWVRITGVGEHFSELQKELNTVRTKDWILDFRIPTENEIEILRSISNDINHKISSNDSIGDISQKLQNKEITLEELNKFFNINK